MVMVVSVKMMLKVSVVSIRWWFSECGVVGVMGVLKLFFLEVVIGVVFFDCF